MIGAMTQQRSKEYFKAWKLANADHLKEWRRKYYLANRTKLIAKAKAESWHKNNRTKSNISKRKWYSKHRDMAKIYTQRWRSKNTEKVKLQRVRWRLLNPEKCKAYNHRKDVKRRSKLAIGNVSDGFIKRLLTKSKRCYWCLKPLDLTQKTIDHIIPIARGGCHTNSNLVVSCFPCNQRKGTKLPHEWRPKHLSQLPLL